LRYVSTSIVSSLKINYNYFLEKLFYFYLQLIFL